MPQPRDEKPTGPLFDLWCRAYSICREHTSVVSVENLASEALRLSDHEFAPNAELMRAMSYDGLKPKAKQFLGKQVRAEVREKYANESGQLELDGIAYPFAPLTMAVIRGEQTCVIPTPETTFEEKCALYSREKAEALSKAAICEDLNRMALQIHGRAIEAGDPGLIDTDQTTDGDAATPAA